MVWAWLIGFAQNFAGRVQGQLGVQKEWLGVSHTECEIFTSQKPEADESEHKWRTCTKNPGHKRFISIPDFKDKYLQRIGNVRGREDLRSLIDLTVRLRVRYTSEDRPQNVPFSDYRGTNQLRVGTGFIWLVGDPEYKPCPCKRCGGKERKIHYKFNVLTAQHVVFNTEEAKNTDVDLFYDDTASQQDGRMKCVRALEVVDTFPDNDLCYIRCVTCDEQLGKRIKSDCKSFISGYWLPSDNLRDLSFLQSSRRNNDLVLVVSHPHAQPKQVSVGDLRYRGQNLLRQYTAPTCPGSSGAPVFVFHKMDVGSFYIGNLTAVHNGGYVRTPSLPIRLFNKIAGHEETKAQLNYGHDLM